MREGLSPTFQHGLHALQSARSAGWLTTYEFEEELLKLFTQCAAAAAQTSTTPSPADSTSGGLGAQVATATARDTEILCGPSPISPRDVLGAQVPTKSTTAHPVDQVRVQGVVKIETLPESPTMLQGPSRGLCPAQTSGSPMTLNSHLRQALRPRPTSTWSVSKLAQVPRPLVLHVKLRQLSGPH